MTDESKKQRIISNILSDDKELMKKARKDIDQIIKDMPASDLEVKEAKAHKLYHDILQHYPGGFEIYDLHDTEYNAKETMDLLHYLCAQNLMSMHVCESTVIWRVKKI